MSKIGWLLLSVVLLGCADEMDPASLVEELRLLAVQADRPFALPGDKVTLDALAHDPEGRPLSWGWGLCKNPDSTAALDCLRELAFDDLTIAADSPHYELEVPASELRYLGVAVVVCPGSLVRGDTEGIEVSCVDAAGAALPLSSFEIGMKRIVLLDSALNHNPAISELSWDGAPWPEGERKTDSCARTDERGCASFSKHQIMVRAKDAAESSTSPEGQSEHERAVLQFYATAGEFEDEVRLYELGANTWQARREDAGKLVTLWFVVRDNRGGVSWTSRTLEVP